MTMQSSELLIVGDQQLNIASEVYPLEWYFDDEKKTAADHWNLTLLSTAENRGYWGTWEIKTGGLYLVNLLAYRITRKGFLFWKKNLYPEITVRDLFPEAENNEVKATWASGTFSAYTKRRSNPVDDRLSITVEKGNVVRHQWYHLEGASRLGGVPYDKPLPH